MTDYLSNLAINQKKTRTMIVLSREAWKLTVHTLKCILELTIPNMYVYIIAFFIIPTYLLTQILHINWELLVIKRALHPVAQLKCLQGFLFI